MSYIKCKIKKEKDLIKLYSSKYTLDSNDKYGYRICVRPGDIQEVSGNIYFKNNGYKELICTVGNKHGFDGILIDNNNKLHFLESKLNNKSLSAAISSAEKTMNNYNKSDVRYPQLVNSKSALVKYGALSNELDIIDAILERQETKISLNIPIDRQLFVLGSIKKIDKAIKMTIDKINSKKGVIIYEYEEI